ncbi:MAG: DoxX family protein [Chromatiales bacterium]|nr:DoxX family protein [Chromatiales bacterium]
MNDSGKLILRLALGGLILLHGVAKLSSGIEGITRMVTSAGLPDWVAYGVYVGEILAPLMVIAGWFSRIGAGIIAVNMVFAIALAHRSDIFELNNTGGWELELQGMYLFTALAVACLGPGRYSANRQ